MGQSQAARTSGARRQPTNRRPAWLDVEHNRTLQIVLLIATTVLPLAPAILLIVVPSIADRIEGLAYFGVFLINFLLTAHIVPVPGMSALAQAVIVRQAAHRELPWLIGIAGGLGMGIAEVVPYFVGNLGQRVERSYEDDIPEAARRWGERVTKPIAWLMHHFAEPTLFLLSAIPNPFYEVAGLSAGSTRLSFVRFIVPTLAGKLVRGLVLAYVGTHLPFV